MTHQGPSAFAIDVRQRFARFRGLLGVAEGLLGVGDLAGAAAAAQIAARYAFPRHVGLFGSPRLERLLLAIGRRISSGPPPTAARARGDRPRDVLHVLTYARHIGGDSRYVWRWILEDKARRHSVAITSQDGDDIPTALATAVARSGGVLRPLAESSPVEKALELRRLCHEADVVLLHLFPYDTIPVLALAGCESVPTGLLNHADHSFWIGGSVANVVVHLRQQPSEFLVRRRGLDPSLSALLPIPLVPTARACAPAEAKAALGYGPDVVLLATIASAFKYESSRGEGFLDLVTPVLLGNPQASLLAVGPEPVGPWQSLATRCPGRVTALGTRWDNDLVLAAADVYLDSFPFASITSALEAGCHGIPLLACRPRVPELWPFGPGAPGLDEGMDVEPDAEAYRERLTHLIRDAELRRSVGQRAREAILSLHTGGGWLDAVEEVYRRILGGRGQRCLVADDDTFGEDALDLALAELYSAKPDRLPERISTYSSTLPARSQLRLLWRLRREGFPASAPSALFRGLRRAAIRAAPWIRSVKRHLDRG